MKALKAGRAPGLDQVTAESLKLPELHEELLEVLNDVYLSSTKMALECFDPHSKERRFVLAHNYRGIALMFGPVKLYNRVLLDFADDIALLSQP